MLRSRRGGGEEEGGQEVMQVTTYREAEKGARREKEMG